MKTADIVIGETYYTKVGNELTAVRIAQKMVNYDGKTIFMCDNIATGRELKRSAAALRKENRKFF
jgi:hypothetical protein